MTSLPLLPGISRKLTKYWHNAWLNCHYQRDMSNKIQSKNKQNFSLTSDSHIFKPNTCTVTFGVIACVNAVIWWEHCMFVSFPFKVIKYPALDPAPEQLYYQRAFVQKVWLEERRSVHVSALNKEADKSLKHHFLLINTLSRISLITTWSGV